MLCYYGGKMRVSVLQMLKNLRKNLSYMLRHSLSEREEEISFNVLDKVEDIYYYSILSNPQDNIPTLKILNNIETIELLIHRPKSFCRFGDGEIRLITGNSIPFQKYSRELSDRLLEVLKSNNKNLYVGINYGYFHFNRNVDVQNRKFWLLSVKGYRDFLLENCIPSKTYIDAGFNQVYMGNNISDYDTYFNRIKSMFKDKKLVIVSGEGIIKKLRYDIFELAKEKIYIYAPIKNAYDKYKDILNSCLNNSSEYIIVLMVGPTSKLLAYDLTKNGYTAWDFGHLAEDYDAYKKGIEKNIENVKKFYAPN